MLYQLLPTVFDTFNPHRVHTAFAVVVPRANAELTPGGAPVLAQEIFLVSVTAAVEVDFFFNNQFTR